MTEISIELAVLFVLGLLSIVAYLRYPSVVTIAVIIAVIGGYVTFLNLKAAF
ncbi:hypothetical protein [Natronobacterium texcoconense]|uniref:Uncharacterized protein n=1 Tax=Natronobacterium texcoconense TaxID=1095778 RepID=A0A1H1BAH6_NATTX|nr:hypothetical protein [Natronobacterium texcoconense]SDQ48396.1 hypothetical protein SAMN04489842_0967 [Natronobacterium texcoconense]